MWNRFALQPEEIAKSLQFSDVQWAAGGRLLVWLEIRSGRGVLVARNMETGTLTDLTRSRSVRGEVGYGGGEFFAGTDQLYFVSGGVIWSQGLMSLEPRPLVSLPGSYSAPVASPDERYVLFVRSHEDRDTLNLVRNGEGSEPEVVARGDDFYMQPVWHPNRRLAAWVGWRFPWMPWDSSKITLAQLDVPARFLPEGRPPLWAFGSDSGPACFQPAFSPDGNYLSFITNESGWFNLKVVDLSRFEIVRDVKDDAEHALPAWIQGLRTHAWEPDSKGVIFLRLKDGFATIKRLDLGTGRVGSVAPTASGYTSFGQPSVSPRNGTLALIASSPALPPRIITLDSGKEPAVHRSAMYIAEASALTGSRPVSWESASGTLHGLFQPASGPTAGSAQWPAVIKIHGGPTSQYRAEFDPDSQYFCSRGFAVLALNYRGSAGYGSHYARLLSGRWGIADVEDVCSAAEYLTSECGIDPARIILAGNSAGGFTVYLALARFPGRFRAGIVRYGVADLLDLTLKTHKFESRYLDALVGTLPEHARTYAERSPVNLAGSIEDPLAIFHGEEDRAVPRAHSDAIAESLSRRGVPHLYRVFPGEGHGFRLASTLTTLYRLLDQFLLSHVPGLPGLPD